MSLILRATRGGWNSKSSLHISITQSNHTPIAPGFNRNPLRPAGLKWGIADILRDGESDRRLVCDLSFVLRGRGFQSISRPATVSNVVSEVRFGYSWDISDQTVIEGDS